MEKKTGYSITTYKFRLDCRRPLWLYKTREIYNLVLGFYYKTLRETPELSGLSGRDLLRKLEILTIGRRGQDKAEVLRPLPYGKVPLYFRRAAINDAIRLFQVYRTGEEKGGRTVSPAKGFCTAPVFYKGMCRDFTETGISLKLWNGETWVWEACRLDTCGRKFPEPGQILSPVLKLKEKKAMLHVPVKRPVEDVRTVKERFSEAERICSAAFPGNDCMAVLAVLNKEGKCEESRFIRGGKELGHKKKKLLNRIRKNRASMGFQNGTAMEGTDAESREMVMKEERAEEENKYLKEKIRDLTDRYAHKVSREIVDFCEERDIKILVVPNYKTALDSSVFSYLTTAGYDWLGRRIIQYLRYKAFARGIVVTSVSPAHIASICYQCGQPVKRFNKENRPGRNYYGGKNYICPNGHKGNAHFNAAMNIGRRFLAQAEGEKGTCQRKSE